MAKRLRDIFIMLVIMTAVYFVLLMFTQREEKEAPYACLSMISPDNSFTVETVNEFKNRLSDYHGGIRVAYCGNDINAQINQIENFIAMRPEALIVECMGDASAYERLFREAKKRDIQVVTFGSARAMANADIQMLNSHLSKGLCISVLIKDFLDRNGVTEEGSVKTLLLGDASTEREIMSMAGYQLISEKYLRRYDLQSMTFERYESGPVYYTDGYGVTRQVEEPTGGLILDEDGEAIVNLYYEPRISLITGDNYSNVQTNLEGQRAIDGILSNPENIDIQIVIATSGEAAIGAAFRLEEFIEQGELTHKAEEIAVFGAYNTLKNRELVERSINGNGVFRGFVGDFVIEREADNIIRNLLTKRGEIFYGYSFYSGYDERTGETGMVVLYDPGISMLDIFSEEYA